MPVSQLHQYNLVDAFSQGQQDQQNASINNLRQALMQGQVNDLPAQQEFNAQSRNAQLDDMKAQAEQRRAMASDRNQSSADRAATLEEQKRAHYANDLFSAAKYFESIPDPQARQAEYQRVLPTLSQDHPGEQWPQNYDPNFMRFKIGKYMPKPEEVKGNTYQVDPITQKQTYFPDQNNGEFGAPHPAIQNGQPSMIVTNKRGEVKTLPGLQPVAQTPAAIVNMSQEKSSEQAIGKGLGEDYMKLQKDGAESLKNEGNYKRLGGLLDSVSTGKLKPTETTIAAYLNSMGLKIDKQLPNAEAAKAISNMMALELRNPSNGAGMPGAMSDADRNYLQGMIASIDKTPGANKLLIEGTIKVEKRKQDVAKLARDYRKKNGGKFDEGFYEELQAFSDSHPLFDQVPAQPAQRPPLGSFFK